MSTPPQPGTPAKDFTLPNAEGRSVRLGDFRGKNVVLAFYPADWSPACSSQMALIQEVLPDIRGHNAEVIGVSVDGRWSHKAWAEWRHIVFPLLSDCWPHGLVARQYGVFRESEGLCDRALVFIDSKGVIRDCWVAENPAIAPGLNLIFDALERIDGARGKGSAHV